MLDFPDADIASTRAQIERVAAIIAAVAPYQLPLLRAARDGLLALCGPTRAGSPPWRILESTRRPIIILIGDDDGESTGPAGWACAKHLRCWGKSAMVHAAGGLAEHYETAVSGAMTARRYILVETTSEHRAAWERLLAPGMPVLSIRPDEGSSHPISPAAREAN